MYIYSILFFTFVNSCFFTSFKNYNAMSNLWEILWTISAKIPTFTNYNTTLHVNDTKQCHYFTRMLHCCACTYISVHLEVWFCCKLPPAIGYSTERERENEKKNTKLFTPSLSPWNICVYCEYQNNIFFFIYEASTVFLLFKQNKVQRYIDNWIMSYSLVFRKNINQIAN